MVSLRMLRIFLVKYVGILLLPLLHENVQLCTFLLFQLNLNVGVTVQECIHQGMLLDSNLLLTTKDIDFLTKAIEGDLQHPIVHRLFLHQSVQ